MENETEASLSIALIAFGAQREEKQARRLFVSFFLFFGGLVILAHFGVRLACSKLASTKYCQRYWHQLI